VKTTSPANPSKAGRSLTVAEIDLFGTLEGQLSGMHAEFQVLAKKNPHDKLNTFKLRLVNTLLERTNALFDAAKTPLPLSGFTVFEEAEMPSVSDVLMMVAQYLQVLEKLRADNIKSNYGAWSWVVDGEVSNIRTRPPRKISE
jgi:hypothetical protein